MRAEDVTGLVLAGGRGQRMGGVDKGLQLLAGRPLALHALERLAPQVGRLQVNANRHIASYQALGAEVIADADPSAFDGPLAGFLVGLKHCATDWLCTVPCDTPLFPTDLVHRLARAAEEAGADVALPCASEEGGRWRAQPVFCLMRASLAPHLAAFMQAGGRKIDAWTAQHPHVLVRFDQPGDDPCAFFNANTLAELQSLEPQVTARHMP